MASINFAPFRFDGAAIRSLMRQHRVTIRQLAARMDITLDRIRYVRREGIAGHAACDWYQGITGDLSEAMRAYYRSLHHSSNN